MFKSVLVLKAILIFMAFTVFSFGNMTVYGILGILLLLGGCFIAMRQGAAIGHEACSITHSLQRVAEDPNKARQLDGKMTSRAFSTHTALKAVFAGALIDYVINAFYIILMLLKTEEASGMMVISRLLSFVVSIPYWSVVSFWHETYNVLSWDIAAVLMIGPFLLPIAQLIGYKQGPALWAKTEKAMADGKRRAKARSRIVKKKTPRGQRPEI